MTRKTVPLPDRILPSPVLDGELLRAFVAFADELNFTRAAARVGLSQPALSERVQRLASLLEAPLHERDGRSVVLTARGKELEAFARDTLVGARMFEARFFGREQREGVRLAAGEGTYLYLLADALRGFRRRAAVDLTLLTLGASDAAAAVGAGKADLGVLAMDLLPAGLEGETLVDTRLVWLVPREHRLATKRALKLADLEGESLILPPEGRAHRDFVVRALSRHGMALRRPVEADGWPLAVAFASMGLGIAAVNEIVVRRATPEHVVVRAAPELGTVPYRLVWRAGRALSPAVQSLREALIASHRRRRKAP